MPYEKFGIIKVPERSARLSACIAVCYLHVPLYRTGRAGPRTECSTVLGVFTGQGSGVRGQLHNYRRLGKVSRILSETE